MLESQKYPTPLNICHQWCLFAIDRNTLGVLINGCQVVLIVYIFTSHRLVRKHILTLKSETDAQAAEVRNRHHLVTTWRIPPSIPVFDILVVKWMCLRITFYFYMMFQDFGHTADDKFGRS